MALDVAAVTVEGAILLTGDTAPSCDADSSRATDCTIPAPDEESWTSDEVWFYGRYGRRPVSGEYIGGGFRVRSGPGSPAAPPGDGGGGGGGGASPAPLPPTGPVDPPGIPSQPGTPTGPADPPVPPKPPTNFVRYVSLRNYRPVAPREDGLILQKDFYVPLGGRCWIHEMTASGTFVQCENPDGTLMNMQDHIPSTMLGNISMWGLEFINGTLTGMTS